MLERNLKDDFGFQWIDLWNCPNDELTTADEYNNEYCHVCRD